MGLKVCQLCAVDFTLKKFLLPLVDGMERSGMTVTAVCSDGPEVAGLRAQGYRIQTVSIARGMNPLLALRSVLVLAALFRRERFDIVHVHTPVAALIGRVAARAAGVPCVIYTAHGFYHHDQMPAWKRRLFVGLERFARRFTHLLFCQSAEDAREAVVEGIAPGGQAVAIGNGVDTRRFDPAQVPDAAAARGLVGIPPQAQVVGIIGRLVREKGYTELLAAAASLADSFPNLYVLLVGGRLASDHDDSIAPALAAARARLGPRLVEAGLRDDTPVMLAAMDIFCLPSYREGMPRTIIEAMMMGKPVVATNIRGCREEVVDGQTGLLVPPRDAPALATALSRCLADPGEARRMGAAGRVRALELYDESRVVALQIDLIRKHLATHAGQAAS